MIPRMDLAISAGISAYFAHVLSARSPKRPSTDEDYGPALLVFYPILEYYTLTLFWFLGSYYNNLYLKSLYFFFWGVLQTRVYELCFRPSCMSEVCCSCHVCMASESKFAAQIMWVLPKFRGPFLEIPCTLHIADVYRACFFFFHFFLETSLLLWRNCS